MRQAQNLVEESFLFHGDTLADIPVAILCLAGLIIQNVCVAEQ